MDEKIVTHICSECKGFVDPGMQKVIELLRQSDELPRLIAAEVLSNSNEHAAEVLRINECPDLIPGTNWAVLERAGEFYGMRRQQIYSLLAGCKMTGSSIEHDIVRVKTEDLPAKLGLIGGKYTRKDIHKCKYSWSYKPAGRRGCYKFNAGYSVTLISARVLLAVAALKSVGSYRVGNPTVSRVYETMLNSSYGVAAKAAYEERLKAKREESRLKMAELEAQKQGEQPCAESVEQVMAEAKKLIAEAKVEPSVEDVVEQAAEQAAGVVPESPQLSLSFDELTALIKAAVKEAMIEMTRPVAHKTVVLTQ